MRPSQQSFTMSVSSSPEPARHRMADVLIALGGNLGNVRRTFEHAITAIQQAAQATLLQRSADYLTPPWGQENQPPFINACIRIETDLAPRALLEALQQVEQTF